MLRAGCGMKYTRPDISGQPLADVHATYRRWFGAEYDFGALDAVLCTAAAEQLAGDPPWLLLIGGSGAAKTETIIPLSEAGATVISTISGEAALLSGTSIKDRAKDATGGLLKKIGDSGTLVIKDVTSILSMNRDTRALVLAALREIYDGRWSRNVGTDGGQTRRGARRCGTRRGTSRASNRETARDSGLGRPRSRAWTRRLRRNHQPRAL
jgi:hypothetical protein